MNQQDKRWMDLAKLVATWSEDPDTQVGSCIVDLERKNLLEIGWNGIPRGVKLKSYMLKRPEKYDWFEHAERNSIYNAAFKGNSIKGATLYCTLYPCPDCARAIIQSGILEVVILGGSNRANWKPHWPKALEVMVEAELIVRVYE